MRLSMSLGESSEGIWASLSFHEFISNPQPLGFTRGKTLSHPSSPLAG